MDDNKKFSIREYRESLYNDISKKKKEQRKKLQAKYLQKLGMDPEKETMANYENDKLNMTTNPKRESNERSFISKRN